MKIRFFLPILLLAILSLTSCQSDNKADGNAANNAAATSTGAAQPATSPAASEADNIIVDSPKQSKRKLACGTEIVLLDGGVEAKILQKIEAKEKPAPDAWMDFDQLAFKTDGTTLDVPKSIGPLSNIAQLLKCYPNLKLKIGAFGNHGSDQQLSTKTAALLAETLKATLIGMGAQPSSLQTVGLGNQQPKGIEPDPKRPYRVLLQVVKL